MLEAKEIAEISFELVRSLTDRLMMSWEDDRGHLLREISSLQASQKKEARSQRHLQKQIRLLASRMNASLPSPPSSSPGVMSDSPIKPIHDQTNQHKMEHMGEMVTKDSSSESSRPSKPSTRHVTKSKSVLQVQNPPNKASLKRSASVFSRVSGEDSSVYSESSRGKRAREALKGFTCAECEGYFQALAQQGVHVSRLEDSGKCRHQPPGREDRTDEKTDEGREPRGGLQSVYSRPQRQDLVQLHSRHRDRSTPPPTPEGFWDLTVNTPEEWRRMSSNRPVKK